MMKQFKIGTRGSAEFKTRSTWAVLCLSGLISAFGCVRSGMMIDDRGSTDGGGDAGIDSSDAIDTDGGDESAIDVRIDSAFDAAPDGRDATSDGTTDARPDAPAACVCPVLPTSCTLPTGTAATFSPSGDAMLRQLFSAIACADNFIHAALYETTWDCIARAILDRLTAAPSLRVEIVFDNEQCPRTGGLLSCELSRLDGHPRVTMIDDMRSALMHEKFLLIDGEMLWISSGNLSRRSFCQDANNSLAITDTGTIAAFESEFQRMFNMRMFGPRPDEPPTASGPFSIYFGPRSPIADPARWYNDMVAAVGRATTSVHFAINAFTRPEVATALIAARTRGVDVRGVVSSIYAAEMPVQQLIMAGVPIRIGDVHSKTMVIDGMTVITGSANWSTNAFGNNEYVVFIQDTTLAGQYQAEIMRLFGVLRAP